MNIKTTVKSIAAFLLVSSTAVQAATCIPIGGVGMPNFAPQPDGTVRITAPLMGSVGAASGTITAQRETKTGLEMDLNHYFMNDKGGFFHTRDRAVLTAVPGKDGRYMIEINYQIEKESTSGVLKGYEGKFKSYGLVDLNQMQGLVRYSGEICKK